MVRTYKIKNPYFKNARISVEETVDIVHYFLRGIKASVAAKEIGISEASAHKIYTKLRAMVISSGFGADFSEILDEHEPMLWTLFQAMRVFLINVGVPYDPELEEALEDEPEALQMLHGVSPYCVMPDQLYGCMRNCDTGTPPIIIRKMKEEGKIGEVIERRSNCKTCSLKLLEFYKPARSRTKIIEGDGETPFTLEPHHKYVEDQRDLLVLWVEVLDYLADYRNIREEDIRTYAMQGVISLMLKRAEYKVKNIHFGADVKPIFLDKNQLLEVEKGYSYQSQLDGYVLSAILKRLKENPI